VTADQINSIGIAITALVTIIGWIYTASVQKNILRETIKTQKFERELGVFRERLINIRNLTSNFIDQSISYSKLVVTLQAEHFDKSYAFQLLTDLSVKEHDLEKILYDPSFRSITNMLPQNNSDKLLGEFEKTTMMISAFHKDALGKLKSNSQETEFINILANKALNISQNLNTIANMFAIEFANLDRGLANVSEKQ